MLKTIIKYAIDKTTNKVMYIDNVPKGLPCNCVCAECGSDMVAVKGKLRKWHFRHHIDSDCRGGLETVIHKLAKEIIVNNSQMALPSKTLNYFNAKPEERFEGIIPDVSVMSDEKPVFMEIHVRHRCESAKEEFYKNRKLNSFEIDLSKVSYKTSVKELEDLVLKQTHNKKFIYWEENPQTFDKTTKAVKNNNNRWLGLLIAFVLGIILFFGNQKRKRY